MDISYANTHETSLIHLGEPRGFVADAKCNRDSYKTELDVWFSFYFVLLEDEQKVGVGYLMNLYLTLFQPLFDLFFSLFLYQI